MLRGRWGGANLDAAPPQDGESLEERPAWERAGEATTGADGVYAAVVAQREMTGQANRMKKGARFLSHPLCITVLRCRDVTPRGLIYLRLILRGRWVRSVGTTGRGTWVPWLFGCLLARYGRCGGLIMSSHRESQMHAASSGSKGFACPCLSPRLEGTSCVRKCRAISSVLLNRSIPGSRARTAAESRGIGPEAPQQQSRFRSACARG